jgi:PadR family transcriptional regulator PadR
MAPLRMTQITALVLTAVANGHRYGFDIMEACDLPSGTVYPALRRLEKAGLLRSGWEDEKEARAEGRPRRRRYAMTAEGWTAMPRAETKLAEVRRLLGHFSPTPSREA